MTITEGRVAGGRSRFGCGSALPEIDVHVDQEDASVVHTIKTWLFLHAGCYIMSQGQVRGAGVRNSFGLMCVIGGVVVPFHVPFWGFFRVPASTEFRSNLLTAKGGGAACDHL